MDSAREKALSYLSRFARTERQVAEYLSRKGFPDSEISDAVSFLRENRFLDDSSFAESFVQSKIRHGDGPLKIKKMLLQKGIQSEIADRILKHQYPSELQLEKVRTLLRQKGAERTSRGREREKIFRSIASRGFPLYVIIQAFKEISHGRNQTQNHE